jgi:PIF1-like helicase/Helitron helicase-like domain at N-terminus
MGNTDDQINRRCHLHVNTKREIVAGLQNFFEEHNELLKLFKTAIEQMPSDDYRIVIKADKTPVGQHERKFNAPTIEEVAIVIVGEEFHSRDVILYRRNGNLERVSETHRSYDALQYPILFWQGEDGYHFNISMKNPTTNLDINKKVSAMNYYAYRMMIRENADNHILKCRQLFHQYIVDMYAKIESERLLYIRLNQTKLRSEEYIHLRDAVVNDGNLGELGKIVILPSTFTGSPRHMHEYAQDAMTYVRAYGRPDLFITFTCNPAWDEIKELLLTGQSPSDRHDISARVFKQKLKSLIDFIVKHRVFGETRCWMYSVEWQKRGLPHAHILIWMMEKITPNRIDEIISAEIPDIEIDKDLHDIVSKNMIHGPCGSLNNNSPCMSDGKCTKRYPRDLLAETITGNDGYPLYRRRSTKDGGKSIKLKVLNNTIDVDNRWVVPYSPLLLKTYNAHINVEYCNSVKSIKYICKYVNKGSDMAVFGVENTTASNDEVTRYQLGRYISSNEAVWRIFSFSIHERYPTVLHLAVHLENGQRVYFTSENVRARAMLPPPNTTLTAFFKLCQEDPFARTLLYPEVPTYYTWDASRKVFCRRKTGKTVPGQEIFKSDALGRVYTVHPNNAQCYFLRMLLHTIRGPRSFEELRTVDGELCENYREACRKLKLLEGDHHWEDALAEAQLISAPAQIRNLFAIILTCCNPSDPIFLWEKSKESLSEDILKKLQRENTLDITFSPDIFNEALVLIENRCLAMAGKGLLELGLTSPIRDRQEVLNADYIRETSYSVEDLTSYITSKEPLLNEDQKKVSGIVMERVQKNEGGIIFLDASGGTGKTFTTNLILAKIRARGEIALAIASSGIAATLMEGGRTAHSLLKLPLDIARQENPTCNIKKNSTRGKLLKECRLIVWDECTMAHKRALEALNATLKDIRDNNDLMGGALVLLCGDFRQTLPVIPRGTPADELYACLKHSFLWRHVQKISLSINMRVHLGDETAQTFSDILLKIGEGKIPVQQSGKIILPQNFCNFMSSVSDLINAIYPDVAENSKNLNWLKERSILAAKNEDVDEINKNILNMLQSMETEYKSIDTVTDTDEAVNLPIEFLNSLNPPGFPPHRLVLKIGSPIILLRNLDPPKLCNGTRLYVKKLLSHVIEAIILTGKGEGETVFIPRIPLIPTDLPFNFKRLQFPIRLAFSITINKSQGQSIKYCGIDLRSPCFSHGQFYVACSRVGSPKNLFILSEKAETKNIVYEQALR